MPDDIKSLEDKAKILRELIDSYNFTGETELASTARRQLIGVHNRIKELNRNINLKPQIQPGTAILTEDKKEIIKLEIHSADFEENTLTLQLPEGFWEKHGGMTPGYIKIDVTEGLIELYEPRDKRLV